MTPPSWFCKYFLENFARILKEAAPLHTHIGDLLIKGILLYPARQFRRIRVIKSDAYPFHFAGITVLHLIQEWVGNLVSSVIVLEYTQKVVSLNLDLGISSQLGWLPSRYYERSGF